MREIVTWPRIRNTVILFLLLFTSLIATQPATAQQFCGSHTGDLYDLPACALGVDRKPVDNAYLTSAEPQTVIASPGQNVSFTVGYQVWLPTSANQIAFCKSISGGVCIYSLAFFASWTPFPYQSWYLVYAGVVTSPGPPGTAGSASFHVIAPIQTGTYYLWFIASSTGVGMDDILSPPAHIKVIVSTLGSTVTVTQRIPSAAISSPSIPLLPIGLGGVTIAVVGTVVVAVRRGKLRFRRGQAEVVPTSKPTISTGYQDLDGTLAGGIPEGYSVVLVSPSYDERDLLLRKIINSAISSGRPAFYISSDIERTQDLLARDQHGFYAFSPQAARIEPKPPNLYPLPSIDNLSDHTLSLSLAIRDARAKETSSKMVLILDTLSDVILRHRALTTRRWLADFVGKRKSEGFTIVATLNPLSISKEDMQTVVDLFDGVIEIFEKELKERSRRFVVVKKMYGRKYSESELMLDKDKLF